MSSLLSMVGYDPRSKADLHEMKAAVAGAVSGMVTRFICQPLDVLKIRFQLQVEPIKKYSINSKYIGLKQCIRTMIAEEEIYSLWKGHIPAQWLSVVYGAVQFTTFETLTKYVWKNYPQEYSKQQKPVVHFVCGGISGCVATVASLPLDVVRTRLVGQGEPKTYKTMRQAISIMMSQEGFTSFFKGISPAMIQTAPYVGLQFGIYTYISLLKKHFQGSKEFITIGFFDSLTAGMIAGFTAKTIVYPLDVIKKRLQVQGFEVARKQFGKVNRYTGLFSCIFVMIREEGILAFYKGLVPSSLKATLATGCNFAVYEMTSQFLIPSRDVTF